MKKLKVLIVDDHPVVRDGLKATLRPEDDMTVVGEVGSADAALREAIATEPDVVLMDVRMPGGDGIQACRMLREQVPNARVIMLTSFGEKEAVRASILAGASGYLLKNVARADLLDALRRVGAGESLLDPAVTREVIDDYKLMIAKQQEHEVAALSEREKEVLALVARGKTNKEIAAALTIAENTARNHVSRIMEKLDVARRSEAAAFAAAHDLVGPRDPRD